MMWRLIILFFIVTIPRFVYPEQSAFIIEKNNKSVHKKPSQIKEEIIKTSGNILKVKTSLDHYGAQLQDVLLHEIENGLEECKGSFFERATLQELKECLAELQEIEVSYQHQLELIKDQLTTLKRQFIKSPVIKTGKK